MNKPMGYRYSGITSPTVSGRKKGLMTMKKQILIIFSLVITSICIHPCDGQESAESGIAEVDFINTQIQQGWDDYQLEPSVPATDGEWCRRVYLDIIGRVPSVTELREYVSSKEADKKKKLVTRLLYDEQFTEDYANNWTTLWTNVLIGRSGGTERNSLTNREGLQKYLRDSLARNKYYNEIVMELVTALLRQAFPEVWRLTPICGMMDLFKRHQWQLSYALESTL